MLPPDLLPVRRSFQPGVAVNLVTFGSPRVGTPVFKKKFNKRSNLQYLRVQNGCDAITQVPFFGFLHVGKHLWLVPRWIPKVLCLDYPVIPIGRDHEATGLSTTTAQPDPFNRLCCVPCGLCGTSPFEGRTFAGPSGRPPYLAACPIPLGICCGFWFTGSTCWDDHKMMRYIRVLNQPKANPYWYTVLTMREAEFLAPPPRKHNCCEFCYNDY